VRFGNLLQGINVIWLVDRDGVQLSLIRRQSRSHKGFPLLQFDKTLVRALHPFPVAAFSVLLVRQEHPREILAIIGAWLDPSNCCGNLTSTFDRSF
jgi:hypothetical protein